MVTKKTVKQQSSVSSSTTSTITSTVSGIEEAEAITTKKSEKATKKKSEATGEKKKKSKKSKKSDPEKENISVVSNCSVDWYYCRLVTISHVVSRFETKGDYNFDNFKHDIIALCDNEKAFVYCR